MVASMFRVRRVISALRRSQPIAESRALFDQVMRTIRATRARVEASAAALTHKARHEAPPPFSGPASAICGIYGMGAGVGSAEAGIGPGGRLASPHLEVMRYLRGRLIHPSLEGRGWGGVPPRHSAALSRIASATPSAFSLTSLFQKRISVQPACSS